MKKHIPNIITSFNLISGFIAITFAANGDNITASWLIIAAMVFDFSDGFSARLLKSYSEIGRELDSLADLVSFGVAPALIIYQLLNDCSSSILNNSGYGYVIKLFIPSVMPACAALRLALFNLDTSQSTSFKGLPTPANALAVVSVVIAANYTDSAIFKTAATSASALMILTIGLSLLMVSRITLLSLKFNNLKLKGNEGRYLLLLLVIISLLIFGLSALPLIIPIYLIASSLSLLF